MDERTPRSRHLDSMGRAFLWAFVSSLVLFLIAPAVGDAQMVTHITPTTTTPLNLGTHVDTVGSTTQITGGTRPGNDTNLFHSFDAFTLGTGDTAHFMNNMMRPTTNIFSRVVGGEISTIDGTLRTNNPLNAADPMNFGAAHLWIINPSGVMLGPNARLDVGGAVTFTTANYLRFDGTAALFDMLSTPASLGPLSVAPVVAFGFLPVEPGATRGTISVQGSKLQVPEGQALSLVGGDITVQSGALVGGTIQASSLSAPGGQINLLSVGSPGGEVLSPSFQTGPNINGTSFTTMGTVTLKDGALLDVSRLDEFGNPIGNGSSGTVFVRGGQLVMMDASTIQATTVGVVDGASTAVDIQALQDVTLTNASAIITQTLFKSGRGGDVHITAGGLTLENMSGIITNTRLGNGVGGDLALNVGKLTLNGGPFGISEIRSTNFTSTAGVGGNVTVRGTQGTAGSVAESVVLLGGSRILSETIVSGDGGRISITATSLELGEASTIQSSTFGTGFGGGILLRAERASLSGGATITSHTDFFEPRAAAGGKITVRGLPEPGEVDDQPDLALIPKAASLTLAGQGSGIISETSGSARLGDIDVHAKTVNLKDGAQIRAGGLLDPGTAGNVTIYADSVGISGGSSISSGVSDADAGQVIITANELTLDNGLIVTSTSSETGGHGGDVVLHVGTVSLTNGASINSQSGTFSTGRAGDIMITGGSLTLANHAEITSSSQGIVAHAGDAGQVVITTHTLNVDNASITTSTLGSGNAGTVTANVGTLTLANGSQISSASTGTAVATKPDGTTEPPGRAGNVTITTAGSVTSDASTVDTLAEANHGGDISITAQNVQLSNGTVITASSHAPLQVTKLVLDHNGQLVPQVVGEGNAGNVTMTSASNVIMQNSSVTTEASHASGGRIEINAPDMVRVTNSKISTSVAGSEGDTTGGNIRIDPQFVILQNSQIVAQAFAGTGGNITITSNVFLADPISKVDASSQLGISGTVDIRAPVQNISGEMAPLSQQFSSAAALLAQRCAARAADGKFSTFVVAGREGLPVEPGGFLASPSLTAELLGSRLSGRDPHTQFSAVAGSFPEYDARPLQLAQLGSACRQ